MLYDDDFDKALVKASTYYIQTFSNYLILNASKIVSAFSEEASAAIKEFFQILNDDSLNSRDKSL